MQKWEYLHLHVGNAYKSPDKLKIKAINGQDIGDWKKSEESLYFSMEQLGEDGWELVDVAWGNSSYPVYIFKRPKS